MVISHQTLFILTLLANSDSRLHSHHRSSPLVLFFVFKLLPYVFVSVIYFFQVILTL